MEVATGDRHAAECSSGAGRGGRRDPRPWRALLASLAIAGALAIWIPAQASAAELAFKGCVTGDALIGPHHSGACGANVRPGGIDLISALAASPDGESLYTATGVECRGLDYIECYAPEGVASFDRESGTGRLTYRGCLSVVPNSGCSKIPSASPGGENSGLGIAEQMVVSPDGRWVYVVSQLECDDYGCGGTNALAFFERDAATGALSYQGCITGDQRAGPSGSGACDQIPSATGDGRNSGLSDPTSVVLSPDGRSLYTASNADSAIARFDRDPATGALRYAGCITGSDHVGPSGSGACAEIPGGSDSAENSGLLFPGALAISRDGASLYVVARGDDSVAQFARNSATGRLSYGGCITGDRRAGPSGSGACTQVSSATKYGVGSGLDDPRSLVVTGDGTSVYVGAAGDEAIAGFRRDTGTGKLTYAGCDSAAKTLSRSGVCGGVPNPSISGALNSLALSADDRSLFTGSEDATVGRFRRDLETGGLEFASCVTGIELRHSGSGVCTQTPGATPDGEGSGLDSIRSLVVSHGTVYAAAHDDAAVARLALAPQTRITRGPKSSGSKHRAVFRFRADGSSTFRCKLKGKHLNAKLRHWSNCGSQAPSRHGGQGYRHLRSGRKVFLVKATDRAHTTDPTPATRRWRIR